MGTCVVAAHKPPTRVESRVDKPSKIKALVGNNSPECFDVKSDENTIESKRHSSLHKYRSNDYE